MTNILAKKHKADVLIITVTDLEYSAVMEATRAITSGSASAISIGDRTYRNLGQVGNSEVYMAISEMGSGGTGGSQENVRKAIEALKPSYVIMVGIAFGIDSNKQKIGDILVAKQIAPYELQRLGNGKITPRGDRPHTSPSLINWLTHAGHDWKKKNGEIRQGLILSGEKLIDDKDFRDELLKIEPEAIGGEMEGAGLYVACQAAKVDWILVKAICDWADGNKNLNKNRNQRKAAKNAATFVLNALHQIPLDHISMSSDSLPQEINQIVTIIENHSTNIEDKFSQFEKKIQTNKFVYPHSIVDEEIKKKLTRLRRSRFYAGFCSPEFALDFGIQLQDGEFSGGSNFIRCESLAWCSRILITNTSHKDKAKKFLELAATLGDSEFVEIGKAFIFAADGDVAEAIGLLAKINTDAARSAALFIQKTQYQSKAAITWLAESGITFEHLDADGKAALIINLFELDLWDELQALEDKVKDQEFEQAPILFYLTAVINLSRAIDKELYWPAFQHLPVNAAHFKLAEDNEAWVFRRKAAQLYSRASEAARTLSCFDDAELYDNYALWLKLRDPIEKKAAELALESIMRDPKQAMRVIPLALQFLEKIDLSAVERAINQETAVTAGQSFNAALARLAFLNKLGDSQKMLDYIDQHREQLYQHFDKYWIQAIEVDTFVKAALPKQAQLKLDEMILNGFSGVNKIQLQNIINNATEKDSTDQLKKTFQSSSSISDLISLVSTLRENEDWEQVAIYSEILFERTRTITDAIAFVGALIKTHRFKKIGVFLRKFPEFIQQSEILLAYWCLILYREGSLKALDAALSQLRSKRNHIEDRRLTAELAITSGNWESLATFAEEQWSQRENRTALELLQTAYAAHQISSPRAKDLMHAAIEKGSTDPNILFGAYSLATTANWVDSNVVSQWLADAARLSNEDGPIHHVSLRQFAEMKPDMDLRSNDAMSQMIAGQMPMFCAAALLNRTLASMLLVPSLANLLETDPRRRRIIPAFSGMRVAAQVAGDVIAIESTVLLNLAQLDMLGKLEKLFQKIVVPHSTLRWLYNEKAKILFHQPSQIENANKLKRQIASGALKIFNPTTSLDTELASEIGEELAAFICEAQIANVEGEAPIFFTVVSPPIYQISSLMEKEADLSKYSSQLIDCNAVLNKLVKKGQLTVNEAEYAQKYFRRKATESIVSPDLPDGAVLFLDDVVVAQFQHTKILEKLRAAGLIAYIDNRVSVDADKLIEYGELTLTAENVLEKIRRYLVAGMSENKISLTPMLDDTEEIEKKVQRDSEIANHPTWRIFDPGCHVDSIAIDERALNRHNILLNREHKNVPILTTLDLLEAFLGKEIITQDEFFTAKTKLRQANYVFVSLSLDELDYYLAHSVIEDEKLLESAELRAVRENILGIQMFDYLQLPDEANWLDRMQKIFAQCLRNQWASKENDVVKKARSDWLLQQLDLRRWAHIHKHKSGITAAEIAFGSNIILLLTAGTDMTKINRTAYFSWLEKAVILPLKNENTRLWLDVINRLKEIITVIGKKNDDVSQQ